MILRHISVIKQATGQLGGVEELEMYTWRLDGARGRYIINDEEPI